ncbi:hypothetical protein UCMB321_3250 [Pseudomonas batumici]|uniref:Uncharacterized protein n=1 Tax=Pseudomonas batumici TaxID=226910 RepID=A0A0C2I842_9PSED|nr:hypothetical protein UCMB321_3250 [Pseudomonas batumici]
MTPCEGCVHPKTHGERGKAQSVVRLFMKCVETPTCRSQLAGDGRQR